MLRKRFFIVLAITLLAVPITAWSFAKPVRPLLPELNGATCIESVYVDEIERTSGLKPPSPAEMHYIRRMRSRTTEAQKPTIGVLPNRETEY